MRYFENRNVRVMNEKQIRKQNAYSIELINMETGEVRHALKSYNTIVAVQYWDRLSRDWVVVREHKSYSTTTSKQITMWARENTMQVVRVDSNIFEKICNFQMSGD